MKQQAIQIKKKKDQIDHQNWRRTEFKICDQVRYMLRNLIQRHFNFQLIIEIQSQITRQIIKKS